MKRILVLLLVLLSVSSAATFGYSRVTVERTWVIRGVPGDDVDFSGALVVNDSNQHVFQIITNPQMDYEAESDGTIRLHYKTIMNATELILKATAVVNVDYDTHILADPPLANTTRSYTNLTEPDQQMLMEAQGLARRNSSLTTILALATWVHENVKYDLSYWGKVASAQEVYAQRRGVCVEYSHLFISLSRSLGFDTRYVGGYAMANSWQAHAWAEVEIPGYGWLPVDPTFGQVGILDSSHLAMARSADQSFLYDTLTTTDGNATLTVDDKISSGLASTDPKGAGISMVFDNSSYLVTVTISNNRPEYLYGSYAFLPHKQYGSEEDSVLLLKPHEVAKSYQGLNHSLFQEGFSYTIPISVSFNDAHEEKMITVDVSSNAQPSEENMQPCAASAILAFLLAAACCRQLN